MVEPVLPKSNANRRLDHSRARSPAQQDGFLRELARPDLASCFSNRADRYGWNTLISSRQTRNPATARVEEVSGRGGEKTYGIVPLEQWSGLGVSLVS